MKKRFQNTLLICFVLLSYSSNAQSISGNLKLLANQIIKLEGFDGLKTYTIATAAIDEKGNFILSYNNS
ncbi:MAG: hypothetical protein RLZZ557_1759, partial [Bacteroidota bacterium]